MPPRRNRPMDSPTRPRSRLPRAIVLCLIGGFLVGFFADWPLWAGAAVVVGASALLSGLLTSGRSHRDGRQPVQGPGA